MHFTTLVLISFILSCLFSSHVYSEEQISAAVKVARIKQIKLSEHIVAYGVLEAKADNIVSLSLAHSGLINQLWIRLGQRVKKGDRLAEIITSPEARMQYFQAKNAMEYAKQQLTRSNRLFSEKLTTKADVENATKNLTDSRSVLNALVKRNQNKSKEILVAPLNGIITQLNLTQGKRVQSNDNAMLIASENHLVARIGIEPEEVILLPANTAVTLSPVFDNTIKVNSAINSINAMVNPSTHLIDAIIDIPIMQAKRLILGTRVKANFILPPQLYFVVPRSAVLNDANGYFIFTLKNKIAHKIYIKKSIEQNNMVAISGNIKLNDSVVILGNYILKERMLTRELH